MSMNPSFNWAYLHTPFSKLLIFSCISMYFKLTIRATHVPVGDDQTQHLELTRDLAMQFNRTVKTRFFRQPEQLISA